MPMCICVSNKEDIAENVDAAQSITTAVWSIFSHIIFQIFYYIWCKNEVKIIFWCQKVIWANFAPKSIFYANCIDIFLEGMNARIKEDYTMQERCNIIQLTNELIQFLIDHENVDSSFQNPMSVQLESAEKYLDRVKKNFWMNQSQKKLSAPSSKGRWWNKMELLVVLEYFAQFYQQTLKILKMKKNLQLLGGKLENALSEDHLVHINHWINSGIIEKKEKFEAKKQKFGAKT